MSAPDSTVSRPPPSAPRRLTPTSRNFAPRSRTSISPQPSSSSPLPRTPSKPHSAPSAGRAACPCLTSCGSDPRYASRRGRSFTRGAVRCGPRQFVKGRLQPRTELLHQLPVPPRRSHAYLQPRSVADNRHAHCLSPEERHERIDLLQLRTPERVRARRSGHVRDQHTIGVQRPRQPVQQPLTPEPHPARQLAQHFVTLGVAALLFQLRMLPDSPDPPARGPFPDLQRRQQQSQPVARLIPL